MVEDADKPTIPPTQEVFPVGHSMAGGAICIGLACIAFWNEIQRFPGPIRLGDVPSIAGRQVAAVALIFLGLFLTWNAFKAWKPARR
jgi:hypothetical protein